MVLFGDEVFVRLLHGLRFFRRAQTQRRRVGIENADPQKVLQCLLFLPLLFQRFPPGEIKLRQRFPIRPQRAQAFLQLPLQGLQFGQKPGRVLARGGHRQPHLRPQSRRAGGIGFFHLSIEALRIGHAAQRQVGLAQTPRALQDPRVVDPQVLVDRFLPFRHHLLHFPFLQGLAPLRHPGPFLQLHLGDVGLPVTQRSLVEFKGQRLGGVIKLHRRPRNHLATFQP